MSTLPWLLRRSAGRRPAIDRQDGPDPDMDAWLETVHRLASGRAADRERLAPAGAELRARLRAKSG